VAFEAKEHKLLKILNRNNFHFAILKQMFSTQATNGTIPHTSMVHKEKFSIRALCHGKLSSVIWHTSSRPQVCVFQFITPAMRHLYFCITNNVIFLVRADCAFVVERRRRSANSANAVSKFIVRCRPRCLYRHMMLNVTNVQRVQRMNAYPDFIFSAV